MKNISFHLLRVGLAITFLWIGVLILKNPEAWGGYISYWAVPLLPIPIYQMMISVAVLDIIVGFLLLADVFTWLAALVGAVHLIAVLAVAGIDDITVRDIGLLAGVLAVMIDSLPKTLSSIGLPRSNN